MNYEEEHADKYKTKIHREIARTRRSKGRDRLVEETLSYAFSHRTA